MTKMMSDILQPAPLSPSSLVGVGLRNAHIKDFSEGQQQIEWLEVHPENYFGYGIERELLKAVAQHYPISFHGVSLSLGSYEGISEVHLQKLKELIEDINPFIISEHASWSMSGNAHLNDLLPLPYDKQSLDALINNIIRTQEVLERQILIENPSTYLEYDSPMSQQEFLQEAAFKANCKILLDVNNVFVNSQNHNFNPTDYIDRIDSEFIEELHIAGHTSKTIDGEEYLIDTHDALVVDDVWRLYEYTIKKKGVKMTLLEWDSSLPSVEDLISEAKKAEDIIKKIDPSIRKIA